MKAVREWWEKEQRQMQRDRERKIVQGLKQISQEERTLAALRQVDQSGVVQVIRLNYWFFTLSCILAGVTILYFIQNGWPKTEVETKFFILMLTASWSSMLLSILWGERKWLKG